LFASQIPALTNACGTVALLHCLANNTTALGVAEDSVLGTWISSVKGKSYHEIGTALDASDPINAAHLEHAAQGQTSMVESTKVRHHFMCFTGVNGDLVELDGAYNTAPKLCGKIPEGETTLQAAARVIRRDYIEGKETLEFAMLAVCQEE
jgi:ubiquitin carboxyl-terminal hydrolase L3